MSSFSQIKYTGGTPGADVLTYTVYDSTSGQGQGARQFGGNGLHVCVVDIKNSASGTLKISKGGPRDSSNALTWYVIEQLAVSPAATTESNKYEFLIEPYSDWKAEWVNGGSAQSTWVVDVALTNERSPAGQLPEPTIYGVLGTVTGTMKATAGNLLSIAVTNRNAAVRYLQLYNTASATTPILAQFTIPLSGMLILGTDFFTDKGWPFSTGITWGISTSATVYAAATASEHDVSGSFR